MTSITQKDSIQSAIKYVEEVKPFHTKVLEIDVEYVADDPIQVNMVEFFTIEDDLQNTLVNL